MFAKSELKRLEQDIVMLDHINEANRTWSENPSPHSNTNARTHRYITFERGTSRTRSTRGAVHRKPY